MTPSLSEPDPPPESFPDDGRRKKPPTSTEAFFLALSMACHVYDHAEVPDGIIGDTGLDLVGPTYVRATAWLDGLVKRAEANEAQHKELIGVYARLREFEAAPLLLRERAAITKAAVKAWWQTMAPGNDEVRRLLRGGGNGR